MAIVDASLLATLGVNNAEVTVTTLPPTLGVNGAGSPRAGAALALPTWPSLKGQLEAAVAAAAMGNGHPAAVFPSQPHPHAAATHGGAPTPPRIHFAGRIVHGETASVYVRPDAAGFILVADVPGDDD